MARVDLSNREADVGFFGTHDAKAAYRQLEVSIVLAVVLAVAACTLGVLVRFDVPESVVEMQQLKLNPPHFNEPQNRPT